MTQTLIILTFFILTLVSCGPRSGVNNNSTQTTYSEGINEKIDSTDINQLPHISDGMRIFKLHCSRCHTPPESNAKDGHTFDGIFRRLPTPSDLYFKKFVQDSKALKQSGDLYAIQIAKDNNNVDYEHHFIDTLSDKNIQDIIRYIRTLTNQ